MQILVVSGFLGAGKTTFIGTLAQKTGHELVIMENEYGETGIDGNLLQKDQLNIWELTEGCICCSLKSDFASSILTIANTVNPACLVVEPTGVGLLSAVMRNIGKIAYERIQLLAPLTIVDAHSVDHYLRVFKDIYTDQITFASRLLLTKTEHIPDREIKRIADTLRALNPEAEILTTPYQHEPDAWWQRLLQQPHHEKAAPAYLAMPHEPDLENAGFTGVEIPSVQELLELLVALLRGYFGTVYRAKGYASVGGCWTRFDVVDRQYSVTLCAPMPEAKVIVIGRHLHKDALAAAFHDQSLRAGN